VTGKVGLLAGNGRLPFLFADAARAQGYAVHAVGLEGECEPTLAAAVDSLDWVKVGQLDGVVRAFRARGVERAVFAGGVGRVRSLRSARPDLGMLKVAARLLSQRDDELLRAVAGYLEEKGVRVVAPTDFVRSVLARVGHLAGPPLSEVEQRDVQLGAEVAFALGKVDVGQTVVVKGGVVLAVEAVEGTDECIRRAGRYGGPGGVVVKRCKPDQDLRFDLPAAGPVTLEVMREAGTRVLAVEATRTILLDAQLLFSDAERLGLSVVGF
jgi:DUF1009 family protein